MPPDPTKPCQPCRVCRKPWDGEAPKTTYTNETWAHDDCLPTPTPLTEAEIQRIEDLEAKATPERWTVENGWSGTNTNRFLVRGRDTDGIHFGQSPRDISDIDLIAALRNAAHALLAAARENAGLREERDDRIRANVGLCEEIKNYRAERDMAQLELSRANVRCEQAHRRAEAMWKERDAALARVAELEVQIRQMAAKYESLEDSYQDMLERGANLAAKVAVFERILTPSLPDPKWVRCPSACSDGMIHAGSGVWRGCFTCGSSGRPGWVKEASQ